MLAKPSKIFLVDDDLFCRQLMEHSIRGLGFENIQTFDNGASCLDALIEEPDIVFLDQMMGSVSGTDALKAIKRFNPDIYVVLVSGQQQVQVAVDSLKFGAFDYVVKDEQLTDRLAAVLAKVEQVQALLASRQKAKAKSKFLSLFSL
jgi:DNA-binding NtrC family response regulator